VEVQSLFSTDVIVDWYAGNQLVSTNSLSYTPQLCDIGESVSILITPVRRDPCSSSFDSGRGYEQAYQFSNVVEALPENKVVKLRQGDIWTNPNRRTKLSLAEMSGAPLRVLTYNILADQNAYERSSAGKQVSFYPYVDVSILDRKRRMPLLLHEILSYQADIICLQEVDERMWRRFFRPALEQAGYQGYFSTKQAEGQMEGIATLWSLHRFESVSSDEMKSYSLNKLVMDTAMERNNKHWKSAASIANIFDNNLELKDVIETKLGHVLQMVSLPLRRAKMTEKGKSTATPERLLLANTHLFYHPLGAHIRLMQMYAICRHFDRFQREESISYPMILCGDMNSSLRRAAGYLLVNRQVLPSHTQIREHYNTFQWTDRNSSDEASVAEIQTRIEHTEEPGQHDETKWEDFPCIELPEHFPSFLPGYPTEPEFTHYLDAFVGSLDHIFISQSSQYRPFGLATFCCAPMPTVEDATENVAMPSEKFPSDHVSLVADVTFTKLEVTDNLE
jgi:2',5'-phosphodiesterase